MNLPIQKGFCSFLFFVIYCLYIHELKKKKDWLIYLKIYSLSSLNRVY